MTQQGGSGNKPKTPEEMKQDIDNLIGKAQSVVTDLMNPQLQEELKKRILKDTEKNLAQALNSFEKIMKEVQEDIIVKSEEIVEKNQVNIEKFKKDLDSVVKDLADPAMVEKFVGRYRVPSPNSGIDLSSCKEISKDEFEAGRHSHTSNKMYYMRKRWQQSMECKVNEKTGREECEEVQEDSTHYYECEVREKPGN